MISGDLHDIDTSHLRDFILLNVEEGINFYTWKHHTHESNKGLQDILHTYSMDPWSTQSSSSWYFTVFIISFGKLLIVSSILSKLRTIRFNSKVYVFLCWTRCFTRHLQQDNLGLDKVQAQVFRRILDHLIDYHSDKFNLFNIKFVYSISEFQFVLSCSEYGYSVCISIYCKQSIRSIY